MGTAHALEYVHKAMHVLRTAVRPQRYPYKQRSLNGTFDGEQSADGRNPGTCYIHFPCLNVKLLFVVYVHRKFMFVRTEWLTRLEMCTVSCTTQIILAIFDNLWVLEGVWILKDCVLGRDVKKNYQICINFFCTCSEATRFLSVFQPTFYLPEQEGIRSMVVAATSS
jgi:hypothetical protein